MFHSAASYLATNCASAVLWMNACWVFTAGPSGTAVNGSCVTTGQVGWFCARGVCWGCSSGCAWVCRGFAYQLDPPLPAVQCLIPGNSLRLAGLTRVHKGDTKETLGCFLHQIATTKSQPAGMFQPKDCRLKKNETEVSPTEVSSGPFVPSMHKCTSSFAPCPIFVCRKFPLLKFVC